MTHAEKLERIYNENGIKGLIRYQLQSFKSEIEDGEWADWDRMEAINQYLENHCYGYCFVKEDPDSEIISRIAEGLKLI